MRRDYTEKKEDEEPKLSIMEKEALRPKSLRITGLQAPSRQLMSASGRMKLEARKLRNAGDKQGYYDLMRKAAAEKIAGEPTVKSQAFVDAQEEAKAGQIDYQQRAKDMIDSFMSNRRQPTASDSTSQDDNMPSERRSVFAPYSYKSDALTVINDPNHPLHDPSTVASLKSKWNIS
jgi:hypothetical protein